MGAPIPTAGRCGRQVLRRCPVECRRRAKSGAGIVRKRLEFMACGVLKILMLTGRLDRHETNWPLVPLIDRLEQRACRLQLLCLSKGPELAADPRIFEAPLLGSRWLRGFAAGWVWSDDRLERPDLLHVVQDEMTEVALALSETRQVPYLQAVTSFRTAERGVRLNRHFCRRLIVTGSDLAEELIQELGIPAKRIVVIPPGIVPPREPCLTSGTWKVPVIGTGGALDDGSGLMIFMEAARRVLDAGYDAEFVIATQRINQVDLRRRAQQLQMGERVTVTDLPTVRPEFWAVLDIYCQPAVVASTGGTLLQAMAHSVPSIATNVRGLRGLIDSGTTGLIVPPEDPLALENAIIALLDHPEEARRMARNAVESVRVQFDPDAEADRLAALYRDVVGACADGESSPR
jgi:glycosyltransferase involved in cell wall biosynthesis